MSGMSRPPTGGAGGPPAEGPHVLLLLAHDQGAAA